MLTFQKQYLERVKRLTLVLKVQNFLIHSLKRLNLKEKYYLIKVK